MPKGNVHIFGTNSFKERKINKENMSDEKQVTMSKADLKAILQSNQQTLLELVKELKKPTEQEQKKLEAQQRELESAQEERKQNSAAVKAEQQKKENFKKICTHMRKEDGKTKAVFVHDEVGGYMLCQQCQDVIRYQDRPELFNRLYQLGSPTIYG